MASNAGVVWADFSPRVWRRHSMCCAGDWGAGFGGADGEERAGEIGWIGCGAWFPVVWRDAEE